MSSTHSTQDNVDATLPDPSRAAASSAPAPAPERKPFRIGPYAVLGQIGRGAMGMVYAAYDEKLDRKVALKLLHSLQDTGTLGPARLLREAQTLARVSHPNVVQVFEVGQHDDEVFIAMEFVRGVTLRSWLAPASGGRPRGWREVLGIYLQAGRGLAAAHAAGVVHRDFKPDNVMIGDDGRVRVMDFGLARALDKPEGEPAGDLLQTHENLLSPTLTADGTLLGTPAYMAPEQYGRGTVDALSDQFAYCVALFEALYGQRPFAGDNLRSLAASVQRGEIREPPRRGVPRWLRALILRGLAVDPAQRWPGMPALLARIERGQALHRLRLAGVALVGVTLLAAGAWGLHQADQARRAATCEAAGASIDEVWNDAARARVRESFAATGVADAAAMAERALPWLDRQAAAWHLARADACMDTELRGLWSADLLDRSAWCLDERRMGLEALVAELAQADKAVLQKAVPAAAGLASVAECRDTAALARLPAPPESGRDEARAIRAEFARMSSLQAAGRFKEVVALATAAHARATTLAWPPLLAEAELWRARSLELQGTWAEAAPALEDAGFAAMQAGALGLAADASIGLIMLTGQKLAKFDDGLRWARFAELAVTQLEPRPGLRSAARLNNLALVRGLTGNYPEARTLQEQAIAIYEATLGPDHLLVAYTLQSLTHTHLNAGNFNDALAVNARTLAIREAALGPDHIDVAGTLTSRAVVLRNLGKYTEALPLARRSLATTEAVLGPEHPNVAVALTNVANIQMQIKMNDEVLALTERGLAIREQSLGPEHPDVAASLSNLGGMLMMVGQLERARTLLRRALAIREKVFGPVHKEVATSLTNLAIAENLLGAPAVARPLQERSLKILEQAVGPEHASLAQILAELARLDRVTRDFAAARRHDERALAIFEKALGPQHPSIEPVLAGLAETALASGRPGDALALARRAVSSAEARGAEPADSVQARFLLARALWDAPADAGRDRVQALVQARAARDAYQTADDGEPRVREVDRWLAKHRK